MQHASISDRNQPWLTSPWPQDDPDNPRRNPIFRKTLCLDAPPDSAHLDICGLGHYELYINARRVGDRRLEPAFTDYNKRVHYSSYDLSDYLVEGENVFALYLGRGRYNMNTISVWAFEKAPWRQACCFTMAGEILADGKRLPLDTENWRCLEGPIFRDSMYEGEAFDARLEPTGWMSTDFDDSDWLDAIPTDGPAGELQPTDIEPIRIVDELPVQETIFADSTRAVFAFPDMLTGNVRIRVNEPPGTPIRIAYAERIDGDRILSEIHDGHITADYFQEDTYICRGEGEETWHSRFSYTGFRYVEISGFTGEFTADQVTALDCHQDLTSRGSFSCSDPLVNRIHHASCRALLNNAHHVITDTPTWEKNGWTGDAQLTATMGLYNFEIERFYRKFLTDMRDSQLPGGELAPIVPTSGWGLPGNPNGEGKPFRGHMPAWDGALFVITWELYQFTANLDIIRENYQAMQKYLALIEEKAENFILKGGLGDWLPPGGSPSERAIMSSTAWFYKLTGILRDCAILLEDESSAKRCRSLQADIYKAFNEHFLNASGDAYESGFEKGYRQTSAIQSLAFGLVPETRHAAIFQRLKTEICKSGKPRLDTGILGTRHLLEVLADNGELDLAYALLTGEDYPSWGNWFAAGQISLGEAWEADARSWTHHMFGSIDAWFYQYLAGIRPTAPGFKKVTIKPFLPSKLESVSARLNLGQGDLSLSWTKQADGYAFECHIPPGIEDLFEMPVTAKAISLTNIFNDESGIQLQPGKSEFFIPKE